MPRNLKCCVGNCQNSRQDAFLHIIPKNEIRLAKWLQCLSAVCDTENLTPGVDVVCHKHFESRFTTSKSRLISSAYPSLFTDDEISSGISSQNDENASAPVAVEHNYARREKHCDHNYFKPEQKEGALKESNVLPEHVATDPPHSSSYGKRETPPTFNISGEVLNERKALKRSHPEHRTVDLEQIPVDDHSTAPQIPSTSASEGALKESNVLPEHVATDPPHSSSYGKRETPPTFNISGEVLNERKALKRSHPEHRTVDLEQIPVDDHSTAPQIPSTSASESTKKAATASTRRPKSKQRLINKERNLSPLCRRIYNEYKKAKAQVSFQKRAKNALKFARKQSFEKLTTNMNEHCKKIINMQVSLCTVKKNARRFTTDEKILALSIMKQSPKCYKFLRKIFILPSKSTLNAMIANLMIEPGINPQVFQLLKKEVESWDPKKKICSIIFDEMSLETALTYRKHDDCIDGFVQLKEKKCEFADHALVFMLRGAVYKWQQPICFYYCQGATPALEIKNILKQLVNAVVKAGLNPIALICDQGAAFQSALNNLKEETRRDQLLENENPDGTITISGVNLNIIYDPSHLIKGLRNNFITKNIVIDGNVSKWQDIVDVYKTDCLHADSRLLHKLNDQCVIPEKIKKMKVKNCVRVLSRTVSAALSYTANFSTYVDGTPVSTTLQNTASTVAFFDELFDSVNGATTSSLKSRGKELRKAVTAKSKHHEFWKEAVKTLEKLKFVDDKGVERSVPSVKNFITTIKSFMRLWQFFKDNKLIVMRPRYFNSDPIENFFGQVRAYGYRNTDPDCHNFSCTFKSLLITRLIKFHNESFNCEDDSAEQAVNLKTLFQKTDAEPNHPGKNNPENIIEQARRERMNTHSRAYTTGWVVGQIMKRGVDCRECQDALTSPVSLDIHDWISHREFTLADKKRLKYPSEGAVRCFSTVITETNEYLEIKGHENKISEKIKQNIISKYSFDFIDCAEHKDSVLDYFIKIIVRFTIINWCNTINQILKGTDVYRLMKRENLPEMQKKALEKFKKKLKNKSFNK